MCLEKNLHMVVFPLFCSEILYCCINHKDNFLQICQLTQVEVDFFCKIDLVFSMSLCKPNHLLLILYNQSTNIFTQTNLYLVGIKLKEFVRRPVSVDFL